jgi:hypothetical protein
MIPLNLSIEPPVKTGIRSDDAIAQCFISLAQ